MTEIYSHTLDVICLHEELFIRESVILKRGVSAPKKRILISCVLRSAALLLCTRGILERKSKLICLEDMIKVSQCHRDGPKRTLILQAHVYCGTDMREICQY